MGHTAIGAADHDGLEAHLLRPVAEHPVLEVGGDLPLRHTGLDKCQHILESLLRDPLGGYQTLDFLLVLDRAQFRQQSGGGNQLLTCQFFLPAVEFRHSGVLVLKTQLFDSVVAG